MKKALYAFLFFICTLQVVLADAGRGLRVHIISIGINNYQEKDGWSQYNNCVNDAKDIIQAVENKNYGHSISIIVNPYLLTEENATIENIREAFQKIIKGSVKEYDYFIFSFAGISYQNEQNNKTYLIPYGASLSHFKENDDKLNSLFFSLDELASLMEQIPCKNQLVISEAGVGESFSENLLSALFESNPEIAKLTERNRVILTTKGFGVDGGSCNGIELKNGRLFHYIKQSSLSPLAVFDNIDKYEFELMKQEIGCPQNNTKYVAIYNENDYRKTLIKQYEKLNNLFNPKNRGSVPVETKETKKGEGKTYGLFIATNTYNKDQTSWKDLKNPVNDADAISELLKSKYNVEITKLINPTKEKVLNALKTLSEQIGENDKFVFFIAGHGYLDSISGGALAFYDCLSLEDDRFLQSYLQMSTLQNILDYGIKSKQILAIFDVCFGSSFDLNAKNITLSDYKNGLDVPLDDFVKRQSEYISRIFIASGKGEVPDYWNNSSNHSPFAKRILQALEDEKEFTSPGKLYSYLIGNATEPYLKRFGKHEEKGDFILKVIN